jgi:hypothetical protein
MARHKKKSEKMPPFVPLRMDCMESTAYVSLTGSAAKLYGYFIRSCIRATRGAPNTITQFNFTYSEAGKYGFARRTFHDALKALEHNGFVEIVTVGGLRGFGHTNSVYKLSGRWATYGGLAWAIAPRVKTILTA